MFTANQNELCVFVTSELDHDIWMESSDICIQICIKFSIFNINKTHLVKHFYYYTKSVLLE